MGYFYIFSFLVTYGNIFATIKVALILNSIELKVNGVYYKIIEFTQIVSFFPNFKLPTPRGPQP